MIEKISIITAFGAGLATFFAPCTFVTLPIFITDIIGSTAEDIKYGGKKVRFQALLNALFYIAGFTVIFVALGMSATTVGRLFSRNTEIFTKISSVFVIFFGIFMVFGERIIFFRFLYKEKKANLTKKVERYSHIRAFVIGVTSAFAWTPCVGPILGAILFYASATTSIAWHGGLLLFSYSLGISVPFLIFAVFVGFAAKLIGKAKKLTEKVYKISGILLILIGLTMFLGLSGSIFAHVYRLFIQLGYQPA